MWYTNILRTCLSNLGRVHGQVNGQVRGQIHIGRTNFTQSSRLETTRLFGALTPRLSQHDSKESQITPSHWVKGVFNAHISRYSVTSKQSPESGPNTGKKRTMGKRKRDALDKMRGHLQDGLLPLREPRTVTSLPEKFKRTGNETFIACEMYPSGDFLKPEVFLITASSGSDKFQRVCKPVEELTSQVVDRTGMVYNGGQVLRGGHPVELTEPIEALQQFIDFVRKHDQPVLIFFNVSVNLKLFSLVMNKWGKLDDFISTTPYCIHVHRVASKHIPPKDFEEYKVQELCKKLMGLQIPDGDVEMRVHGLHRLFTEHLLPKLHEGDQVHINQYYTKNSLVKMVFNEVVTEFTVNRLAHAGIGLDHLNFLAEKGSNEFVRYIRDMKIKREDAERLFSALKTK